MLQLWGGFYSPETQSMSPASQCYQYFSPYPSSRLMTLLSWCHTGLASHILHLFGEICIPGAESIPPASQCEHLSLSFPNFLTPKIILPDISLPSHSTYLIHVALALQVLLSWAESIFPSPLVSHTTPLSQSLGSAHHMSWCRSAPSFHIIHLGKGDAILELNPYP